MKKKIICLTLACVFALTVLCLPVLAGKGSDGLPRVNDFAEIVPDADEFGLENTIAGLAQKYDFDIVILTTDTLEGMSARDCADDFYNYNDFGIGEANDGLLLLVGIGTDTETGENDWWISTKGYGKTAFTDYGIEKIGDLIKGDLSDGEYTAALTTFLDLCDKFLDESKSNKPYDTGHIYATAVDYVIAAGVILAAALIIAFVVTRIMKSKMKTAVSQPAAREYVRRDSFVLTNSRDMFLYSHVARTAKAENSSSGGSSTHTSSSGSTHGGGGGKF